LLFVREGRLGDLIVSVLGLVPRSDSGDKEKVSSCVNVVFGSGAWIVW